MGAAPIDHSEGREGGVGKGGYTHKNRMQKKAEFVHSFCYLHGGANSGR